MTSNDPSGQDTARALAAAMEHQAAGRTWEAVSICREILGRCPDQPEALHLWGLLRGIGAVAPDNNPPAFSPDTERRTAALLPQFPELAKAYHRLGNRMLYLGRHNEAESCYQKALEARPGYAAALNNLGTALRLQGRMDEAVQAYGEALAHAPEYASAHNNLGRALQDLGRLGEAKAHYQKALEINPDYAGACYNLAGAYHDSGDRTEAARWYREAIKLAPGFAESYNGLGLLAEEQGNLDQALGLYRQAVQANPRLAFAHNNLGRALHLAGRPREAGPCFEEALKLSPDCAEILNNLGNVLRAVGRYKEAAACYRQAFGLDPELVEALVNLGGVELDMKRPDRAAEHLARAYELKPDLPRVLAGLVQALLETCDWPRLAPLVVRLHEQTEKALAAGEDPPQTPFQSVLLWAEPAFNLAVARAESARKACLAGGSKVNFSFAGRRDREKITLGYMSSGFRDYPTSHLTRGLYGLHDRGRFRVVCYSNGPDDGSLYRQRIEKDSDRFVDIRECS
ncbi:MAG: tetratricopeptide repeat protein, partial [Thermodesulfobacteriota bacterium]